MTVKETYHADCLRIKQLEQQLARYKSLKDFECNMPEQDLDGCAGKCILYINDSFHICGFLKLKESESEQNDKGA